MTENNTTPQSGEMWELECGLIVEVDAHSSSYGFLQAHKIKGSGSLCLWTIDGQPANGLAKHFGPMIRQIKEKVSSPEPTPARLRESVDVKSKFDEVIGFLLGSNAIDGVWYRNRPTTDSPPFWWRDNLIKAVSAMREDHGLNQISLENRTRHLSQCEKALEGRDDKIKNLTDKLTVARSALKDIDGCFIAAYVEGLSERMAELENVDSGSIHDLLQRRILPAWHTATAALAPNDTNVSKGE